MSDIKAMHKKLWSIGDYFVVSQHLQWVSEVLCEAVDLHASYQVLDIACGNGNTSLAAARRGSQVTGTDLTPAMLELARERAKAEGLSIEFREADAEHLPFDDGKFDIVLSTFGVMFVPDREKTVAEMLRVLKPGGKLGLANWSSNTDVGFSSIIANYTAPAPYNPWSDEEGLDQLLGNGTSDISIHRKKITYRFSSASDFIESMCQRFGPWKNLVESLEIDTALSLKRDLTKETQKHNQSGDSTLVLPLDYLEIIAVKK